MTPRKSLASLAVLLAASVSVLAGCGGGDTEATETASDDTSTTDTPSEAAAETATETASSEDTDAAPAGDVTAPGTELAIGEPATVPFESAGESGVIQIVVDEIVEGEPSDLDELDLGDQVKGYVPYYVNFTVTGVSGSTDLQNTSVDESVDGLLPDGSDAQTLSVFGTWDPCDGETVPGDFSDGASYSSCVPFLAQESTEVDAAQYALYDSDYASYDGEPVVWK